VNELLRPACLSKRIHAEAIGSDCFSISDMTLLNEKSCATGLPTNLKCYGCNMQREQTLAGAKGPGPCVAPSVLPTV
jgi:hypothetical protein